MGIAVHHYCHVIIKEPAPITLGREKASVSFPRLGVDLNHDAGIKYGIDEFADSAIVPRFFLYAG